MAGDSIGQWNLQYAPPLQVCSVSEHLKAKKKAATLRSYMKTNESIIGKQR